jgi:hypothetical protein
MGALAYAVFTILGSLFNLPIYSLSKSIVFMSDLNAFSSYEYIGLGLLLMGLVVAAALALRRPGNCTDARAPGHDRERAAGPFGRQTPAEAKPQRPWALPHA